NISAMVAKEEPLPNNPVENVTWEEARSFGEELTKRSKAEREKANLPERVEFRLPTDGEWWAAATSSSAALSKSPGDGLEWFQKEQHKARNVPVRDDRVYDLFGNVAEWCFDAR